MLNISKNLLKKIFNDDTIYHYTKAPTAIDFILHNNQLRFNSLLTSSDPIESVKPKRSTVAFGSVVRSARTLEHHNDVNNLHRYVEDLEARFNIVCFCKNAKFDYSYHPPLEGNEELYGFTKMRMWDQYADRFKGVCIAFSKEKILELNKNMGLIEKDVEYFKIQQLGTKKVPNIQENHLINVGIEEYKKLIKNLLEDSSFFCKHKDYSGENEYRIGTYFETNKCAYEPIGNDFTIDRTMMLNIKGCIKSIFVSSFANKKQKEDLLAYSNELSVDLIEIDWRYDSFGLIDLKENSLFWSKLIADKK